MDPTPQEIGTLIAVVLKAKNLPNKRQFGKQDPYCSLVLNGETQRTKAVKRGGQHPEFDEEFRFTLIEDMEDILERTAGGDGAAPPVPSKQPKAEKRKIKGGKSMRIYAYADDAREPDLIGEAVVDLTEVLTKGETDEWFTLMNKEKYCGEVYLELTFWSNEAPPEKKPPPPAAKNGQMYGGPGSFAPLDDGPSSLLARPGDHPPVQRVASTSNPYQSHRHDSLPSSLRSTNSAQVNLYAASYDQHGYPGVDQLASDFGELGVQPRRGQTFPNGFPPPMGYSTLPSHPQELSGGASVSSFSSYSTLPLSGSRPLPHRNTVSGYYQPGGYPHEGARYRSASAYGALPSSVRAPRQSIPTSSSGFVPLGTAVPSGFVPMSAEPGFVPPPASYISPQFTGHPGYAHAPIPGSYAMIPPSGIPTQYPPSASFPQGHYPQYPPQHHPTPPPVGYEGYSHEQPHSYEQSVHDLAPQSLGGGRPLPPQPAYTPPQVYGGLIETAHSVVHEQGIYSTSSFPHIPPPPQLPHSISQSSTFQGVPPPPSLSGHIRSSLPQPPVNCPPPQAQPAFIPPGPPPPLPAPANNGYNIGPLTGPHSLLNEHGQWLPDQHRAPGAYPVAT